MDPAYIENKRVPIPGLTQGSAYVYPDYYRRLSTTIMAGNIDPDDAGAIRQQYYAYNLTQLPLPIEVLHTQQNVYVEELTTYEAPASMGNFEEIYHPALSTPGHNQWHTYTLNDNPTDISVDAMIRNEQLYWDTGGFQNFDFQPSRDLPGRTYKEHTDVPTNSTYASTQATPSPGPSGSSCFVCPVEDCRKEFSNSNHLRKHRSTHKGKMLKCPKCNKGYARKDTLLRHLIKLHGMDRDSAKCIAEEIDKSVYE
ncbi:hypothetical protein BZA77DRAFT_301452 [Pyronema omphalodes]|nr:hypothetical protein BZA77DRAFT_301452 [Pyronema omphalodes]